MNVMDIFEKSYVNYQIATLGENIYSWCAYRVLELSTYDEELDELFVKKFMEICNAILSRNNGMYMENRHAYITYIIVCQLLEKNDWIDWGTSIRGAWFDVGKNAKPILDFGDDETVPFTIENLKLLLEFIENNKEDCLDDL